MPEKLGSTSGDPNTPALVLIFGAFGVIHLVGALIVAAVFVLGLCLVGVYLLFGQQLTGGGG